MKNFIYNTMYNGKHTSKNTLGKIIGNALKEQKILTELDKIKYQKFGNFASYNLSLFFC